MDNQDESTSEAGAKPAASSLEQRLTVAEVTAAVAKDFFDKQSVYVQSLERQIEELKQEIEYLRSGGEGYEDKTWIEKVVHCLEDVGGCEMINAAQIMRHLEQRDVSRKLDEIKDPRKMLSVVLSRGVKTGRLYTDRENGVSGKVYGVN